MQPPAYNIRPAHEADLPQVIDLAVDMVLHSTSPYRNLSSEAIRRYRREDLQGLYQALEDPKFKILIADAQGDLLGHIFLHCGHRDSATGITQAWIYDLSVNPRYWSSGIAKALLKRAEAFAAQQGIRNIGLGVTLSNERAVRFYREQGYLDERVQMVKSLGPPCE